MNGLPTEEITPKMKTVKNMMMFVQVSLSKDKEKIIGMLKEEKAIAVTILTINDLFKKSIVSSARITQRMTLGMNFHDISRAPVKAPMFNALPTKSS